MNKPTYVGQAGLALRLDQLPPPSRSLLGHEFLVEHAAFSPDGQRVVTGSYDGTARLWSTPFNNWQELVDKAWLSVWPLSTTLQREALLRYLLDIDTFTWRSLDTLTQKVEFLKIQWVNLTQEQQHAWSFYLFSWLWQAINWANVEPQASDLFAADETRLAFEGEGDLDAVYVMARD